MKAPISWLKEYVDIKLPLRQLMWKMTEVGLTCESYEKVGDDIVLDVEVTANRPDWMSLVGVAREVAAIQGSKLRLPTIPDIPKPTKTLPIDFKTDYKLIERWSAVILSGIEIKPSPDFIQERLKLIGLRPINAIVDITNYVMFEAGIPMHAFDYDEIKENTMSLELSRGGEKFISVDEIDYKLPKDAMIIKDSKRIIDLVGIKGGLNSGITQKTKNILLHVTIDNPVLIRRTSQQLGLRSEASAIYERGPDKGATVNSLKRAANLIIKYANGSVCSEIYDFKEKDFNPWELKLNLPRLEKTLGIKIPDNEVIDILKRLNLSPKVKNDTLVCTIPTYRGDLKIEEDIIEEVARLWGYNKFPKTLPKGVVSSKKVPYYYDRDFELELKNLMVASGYTESLTLSLVSSDLIKRSQLHLDNHIKIANPVSLEFEYLRTTIVSSLLTAVKLNANEDRLKLFEYNKVYFGPLEKPLEINKLTAVEKNTDIRSIKGVVDLILSNLNITSFEIKPTLVSSSLWHPVKSGVIEKGEIMIGTFGKIHPKVLDNLQIKEKIFAFELDVAVLYELAEDKYFQEIPQYPPQIEDLTLAIPARTKIGDVLKTIKSVDKKVSSVELKDVYKDFYTIGVRYQDRNKTLNNKEVEEIRSEVLSSLKKKFGISLKT
ncbi:phenylalanine--tRNA ligase subunit beta [Candidatus Woesebacteria bacterium RIFCSPHIGHO2_01_FULL_39_32]|uniref:Phenylalanine--tRNA ligase beta subunit n=2 Tax=Candidatus Woeseibacteriota TaxID=1752722 RepID=A0A0G0PRC2_9BACT|nr:MAG: Phenylalanine-tRNA ligase beta subunit [Candidatus Woesebacteria bacterium GW2011_GWA1_39_8]OGM05176.1 MAG: phenylalanine--tRNA ligase subunit beta [Candidatus Woesebacteria bacterium GWB1_37_5]OGM23844.1 MAG: phenylalanine--tRNA ligase subunit beta [Candidatus Woesebacteria bacterium RIFCSPHIGHO2_01_FULL_39_32]OGM35727.1 MAG: phenylalanine--tRNA ligase subunit beta [Candidatus Woesebacteria bacterium RIFCSPHIGHO2_12_FULL_38_11]OGM64033.1 MAG: phenylalanine--tRNA ligase subunit beta [Ca